MSDERDPIRWADAASECDPVLQRVLGTAREGLGDATREQALALGIERAVRAQAGHATGAWAPRVGIAALLVGLGAAGWSAWSAWSVSSAHRAASNTRMDAAGAAASATSDPLGASAAVRGATDARAHVPGTNAAAEHAADRALRSAASTTAARELEVQPVPALTPAPLPPETSARPARATSAPRNRARAPQSDRTAQTAVPAARNDELAAITDPKDDGLPAQTAVPPELQLLASAQRALRASPSEALALADRHARAYPAGRFVEEREEIAITALFALGQKEAGQARARRFLARYPRSLSAPRIAILLERER